MLQYLIVFTLGALFSAAMPELVSMVRRARQRRIDNLVSAELARREALLLEQEWAASEATTEVTQGWQYVDNTKPSGTPDKEWW